MLYILSKIFKNWVPSGNSSNLAEEGQSECLHGRCHFDWRYCCPLRPGAREFYDSSLKRHLRGFFMGDFDGFS